MRFNSWATVCLGGTIVSSIPLSISHETYLPYFPSVDHESVAKSYLYLDWAVDNGSLFANNDRIFPPSIPMQLYVPRQKDTTQTPSTDDIIGLFYALEVRPLPERPDSTPTFIRIRVNLLDSQGASVTDEIVVVDLLRQHDGSTIISQIRLDSIQRHGDDGYNSVEPCYMNLWSKLFSKDKNLCSGESLQPAINIANNGNNPNYPQSAYETVIGPSDSPHALGFLPSLSSPIYSGHPDCSFTRLMQPFILQVFLGAMLGLIFWLSGFALVSFLCLFTRVLAIARKKVVGYKLGLSRMQSAPKRGKILPQTSEVSIFKVDTTSA
ncbi:hypothetical protein N7466_005013 [Penicillium verhagenii]|uniref:uncharacterized protein n=1 Tax=Penicillium verhagenii TaxID=1562060 RepID=UPI0025453474|nr:uncharacterized protein N7466_005013 [Penicillium verhagenii]KAJ5935466.1 hypothetical protein N7466_005013 [Penicillium verhagenii]